MQTHSLTYTKGNTESKKKTLTTMIVCEMFVKTSVLKFLRYQPIMEIAKVILAKNLSRFFIKHFMIFIQFDKWWVVQCRIWIIFIKYLLQLYSFINGQNNAGFNDFQQSFYNVLSKMITDGHDNVGFRALACCQVYQEK